MVEDVTERVGAKVSTPTLKGDGMETLVMAAFVVKVLQTVGALYLGHLISALMFKAYPDRGFWKNIVASFGIIALILFIWELKV
jgi:hypothetical protein